MINIREEAVSRLTRLGSYKKQLAFSYSACYRMLPNYQYFSRKFGWGNEYCLVEALDLVKYSVLDKLAEFDKTALLATIYSNIPNSDNFSTSFSTYAQNAASSIYYSLNSTPHVDIQELSWVLVLATDTVDAFIQEQEPSAYFAGLEQGIPNHWMMERELVKQASDFSLLMQMGEIDLPMLESLVEFNQGKSLIDVSAFDL